MPDTLTHPAPRAVHALTNALQTLRAAKDECSSVDLWEMVERAIELISPTPEDIAALFQDNEAKATEIRELLEQGARDKQFIDRLEDKNTALNEQLIAVNRQLAAASREIEALYLATSMENQRTADRFTMVRRVREALDPTLAGVPHAVTRHTNEAPRATAAGR